MPAHVNEYLRLVERVLKAKLADELLRRGRERRGRRRSVHSHPASGPEFANESVPAHVPATFEYVVSRAATGL